MTLCQAVLRLHRYAGLVTALFLIVAGLTGSLLAFRVELDAALNADLYRAPKGGAAAAEDIVARIEAADPRVAPRLIWLDPAPGFNMRAYVQPRVDSQTGRPFDPGFDEAFFDPATGVIVGTRKFAMGLDARHLLDTIYVLHYSLLAGTEGRIFLGIVAAIWTINCFLGLALSFPRSSRLTWAGSFGIRWPPHGTRAYLDVHRAGGLWLWALFLILAVTSVALNLGGEVFRPAVSLFSDLAPSPLERLTERNPRIVPVLTFADAIAVAGRESGDAVTPASIRHQAKYGAYIVSLRPTASLRGTDLIASTIYIDDRDGAVLLRHVSDDGSLGDRFVDLQRPLHKGTIGGLAGRIVVAMLGLAVVASSVTGLVIWYRKRGPGPRIRRSVPS